MRVFILLLGLIVFPFAAAAQDTTIVTPPAAGSGTVVIPDEPVIAHGHSLSGTVPQPRLQAEVSTYRVAAIAVGAVAGVVVANAVTGGMITPILMYGSGNGAGAVMAGGYTAAATHTLVTAAGAIGGGYIADWIYGE